MLVGCCVGDCIEIFGGLSGNECIVGVNVFLFKVELVKGEVEYGY